MAKRKKSTTRRRAAAPATRRRRYTKKADSSYIPAAGATMGLIYSNLGPIRTVVSNPSVGGLKAAANQAVQIEQLKKTAVYTVGGAVAGEAIKKFAPGVIKRPIGKVAKKMPRLF